MGGGRSASRARARRPPPARACIHKYWSHYTIVIVHCHGCVQGIRGEVFARRAPGVLLFY